LAAGGTSYRLKWTHDCNPDGTGHIYKITVHERRRAVLIKDELIKLGMVVELAEVTTRPDIAAVPTAPAA